MGSVRRGRRTPWLTAVGVLTAAALGAACGDASTDQSLANIVLSSAPQGYSSTAVGDNGTLPIDQAASATPADPASVQAYLQKTSWRGAYARVWVRGSDYVEDIGFAFAAAKDAQGLVDLEVDQIRAGQGNYVYPLAAVPKGQGFILYSQTRVGGRNVFCNGAWFAYQVHAFEVLTCGASPGDSSVATAMSSQQYQVAGGVPATPTPG